MYSYTFSSRVPCFLFAFPQLLRVTAPVCTWRLLSLGSLLSAWAGGSEQKRGRCSASGIKTELSHHMTHSSFQSCSFPLDRIWNNFPHLLLAQWGGILWILQWYLDFSQISSKRLKKVFIQSQTVTSWEIIVFVWCAGEIQKQMKETDYLMGFPETWLPKNTFRLAQGPFNSWENMTNLQVKKKKHKATHIHLQTRQILSRITAILCWHERHSSGRQRRGALFLTIISHNYMWPGPSDTTWKICLLQQFLSGFPGYVSSLGLNSLFSSFISNQEGKLTFAATH